MNDIQSLNHTTWDCKYHLVWIPKYRKKVFYGNLRRYMGDVFKELASHKESQIHEGHLLGDHVHMLISIPPKYSEVQVVDYIKWKNALHIARTFSGHKKNFTGQHFWARGYQVSTVGKEEKAVHDYIKIQEAEDLRLDHPDLFTQLPPPDGLY